MELSGPKIKNVLIFPQIKLFLYFGKWNFIKIFFIFQEGTFRASETKKSRFEKIYHILGNGTF